MQEEIDDLANQTNDTDDDGDGIKNKVKTLDKTYKKEGIPTKKQIK